MKKIFFKSDLSGLEYSINDKVSLQNVRIPIYNLIKADYPAITKEGTISLNELNLYREKYISIFLDTELSKLSALEKNVMASIDDEKSFVSKLEDTIENRTFGQIIADKVADFGGSWTFIISFMLFITIWIFSNIYWLLNKGFDPYPFILLNLILSCIAALQAPIIMMSQNRQEEKDRERAKKDYMINLKSELEIRMLDDKLDHLIMHQQQELIEIQRVQIEMMKDILERIKK